MVLQFLWLEVHEQERKEYGAAVPMVGSPRTRKEYGVAIPMVESPSIILGM